MDNTDTTDTTDTASTAIERTRETLAAYAHSAWAGWMRYMFRNGYDNADGSWTLPSGFVERWKRQMNLMYQDLPPNEQWSDQAEADKMLALMGRQYMAERVQCIRCMVEGEVTDVGWLFNGTLWEHQCADAPIGYPGMGVPTKLRGEKGVA